MFLLQLEALVFFMPRLMLAIIAPFAFGTVSSSSAATITSSFVVCQAFGLLHEASISVREAGDSLGQDKVSLHEVPQVVLASTCRCS